VGPLPVDRSRGGDHEPANVGIRLPQSPEEHAGPSDVDIDVLIGAEHRLTHRGLGREVKDVGDPRQGRHHGVRVSDVALDELGLAREVGGARPPGVNLGMQAVENPDLDSSLEEAIDAV
jgi:hypothetical protein